MARCVDRGRGGELPPLGDQGVRKGALPVAEQATAAVGQPLALADRNAGREGLAATRRWRKAPEGIRTGDEREPYGDRQCPTTPPSGLRPDTSPYTGEALGGYVRRKRPGVAARRAADSRPYGGIAGWCVCRRRAVGADAFIGPNPPQAGLFAAGTVEIASRRTRDARPYGWCGYRGPAANRACGTGGHIGRPYGLRCVCRGRGGNCQRGWAARKLWKYLRKKC